MIPDDRTVKGLDELLRQARSARARLEPSWYLNLAFYTGDQWLAWDGRQLYRPALRGNRITIVDNRIQPAVRIEVAKMTKTRPVFVVSPNTPADEDVNAAQVAEALMEYAWGHLHLQALTMKALLWSRICGAGFLKVYWDSSLGEKTPLWVDQAGKIITDAQGAPVPQTVDLSQVPGAKRKTVAPGDLCVEVRSPFQMYVDPLADSFEEAEWACEESVKSADSLKRKYGVDIQPDTPANPGLIEARMGAVFLPGTGGYKGVKVREYWCRPCDKWPDGYRAVWAANKIIYSDDKPFDPFPYVMLKGIDVPGRLWPTSIVEQLRGPQTELNKVRSQIAENRNRVGNPTILASKQSIQDPEKFIASTTQPGGVHFFDDTSSPNAVPTYLQAPPLPDYVIEQIQVIEESIQEISGQHDVSSAQVPPGVTAASAISLLQEADDTRLGPSMFDYEHQLGTLGQKILKHLSNYYTDQRTIRIAGDNGAWQIFAFRGQMLKGNTNVKVQAGSALPQSRSERMAMLQDLMTFFVQSGNPPKGRELAQFLQDMGMGGADRLIDQYTKNETQINRENLQLSQGQQIPVNEYDDDGDHIDGHQEYQKGSQFQMLPPQIQQVFQAHVEQHKTRQNQQQMTQLQLQMEIEGTTPPNLTAPALQNAQQLSQMDPNDFQAAQLHMQGAQQGVDMQGQVQQQHQQQLGMAQQQGVQLANAAQQQSHAQQRHEQQLRHAEELHQARLAQAKQPQAQEGKRAA